MTRDDFKELFADRIKKCEATMFKKADGYTTSDFLSNFKAGASLLNLTPEQVAFQYCSKHMIALRDRLDRKAKGELISKKLFDEALGDIINYMILIDALLQEEE